ATATATVTLKNGVTTDAVGNVAGVSVVPRRYMTSDGRFFAFSTKADASAAIDATLADAADTEDVFLRDMDVAAGGAAVKAVSTVAASATTLVGASAGAPISTGAVIARTGDTVVFVSNAPGGTPADSLVGGFVNGNGDGFDLYVRP